MILLKNIVLFLGLLISTQGSSIIEDKNSSIYPGDLNKFAAKLYRNLLKTKPSENVVFSPISIQTAMTLTYAGTEGQTAEEMRKVLGLHYAEKNENVKYFGEFLKSLMSSKGEAKNYESEISLANRLYVAEHLKISAEFNRIAEENFDALAENVNFAKNQETTEIVNKWVEQQTHEKIKNIINENDIDPLTNIILIDAMYFKGKWKYSFKKEDTKLAEFIGSSNEKTQVEMMYVRGKFNYSQLPELDAKAIELPYNNSNITMLIILPNQNEDITNLEAKIRNYDLKYIPSKLTEQVVCAYIPKFRIEQEIDFKEPLEQIGMSTIFSNRADFSGMFETPVNQYISAVKQKIFLEIDEEGSEAAATTGTIGKCRSINLFYADHPFIFAIRRKSAIYLAGHVNKI